MPCLWAYSFCMLAGLGWTLVVAIGMRPFFYGRPPPEERGRRAVVMFRIKLSEKQKRDIAFLYHPCPKCDWMIDIKRDRLDGRLLRCPFCGERTPIPKPAGAEPGGGEAFES